MLRVTVAAAATILLCAFKPLDTPENSPQVRDWFQSAHNRRGESCCAEADGYRLHSLYNWGAIGSADAKLEIFDDYETRKDGHYWVHIKTHSDRPGNWVDAGGADDVIVPNKAGIAVVWLNWMNGFPVVRCFAPDTGI
jgi:hypothetical protein